VGYTPVVPEMAKEPDYEKVFMVLKAALLI
jgi:hypothetical protein